MSGKRGNLVLAGMLAFGALTGLLAATPSARAAELLVFERVGCVWCERFESEIAPVYELTAEGHIAPLRRVDLSAGAAGLAPLAAPVRYTPTFVLVEDGREVGRIPGYAGEEAFWGLLAEMMKKLSPDTVALLQAGRVR